MKVVLVINGSKPMIKHNRNHIFNTKFRPSADISYKQVLASSTAVSASATASASHGSASVSATASSSGSATPSKSSTSATQSGTSLGSALKSNVVIPFLLVSLSIFYFMI
jgi:hypothetical protein